MKILLAASLPLFGAACSALPELETVPALTAAATSPVVASAQPGPVVAYAGYSVGEPAEWRTLNDEQREGGE
ncbi:hypothetical protein [Thioclava sp. JM3]|uniref:hypothetical protein n=1 Tax=Thioclava sp. JM3 TaxID=1973004 RepID=UPI00117FE12B|nr:hypothetical protein [Thioclava sp. JM3]